MAKQRKVQKKRKQNMPKARKPVKATRFKVEKTEKKQPLIKKAKVEKQPLTKFQRIRLIRRITLITFFTVLAIGLWWIISSCRVTTVYVDGNIHYTNDEITAMVTEGRFGNNTLYLFAKYCNKEIKGVPFIETMSVSIESKDTIRITVYEKSLAGYVEYLGNYMYFDKDGYVVECSTIKTEGIPQVLGLHFDHVILYEKLPIENEQVFQEILSISQMLVKYDLQTDKIYFDEDMNLSLYFGEARVDFGNDIYLEEKLMVLPDILPKLEGKKGLLDLSDYQKGDTITFQQK